MNKCNQVIKYLESNLEELIEALAFSKIAELKSLDLNFKNHLANCKSCNEIFLQHKKIKNSIKNLPPIPLPDNFHFQISKAIYALPDKKSLILIPEFSFKNLALAFSVIILFIFSLSFLKFKIYNNPLNLQKIVKQPLTTKNKIPFNNKSKNLLPQLALKSKINKKVSTVNLPLKTTVQTPKVKTTKYIKQVKISNHQRYFHKNKKSPITNFKSPINENEQNYEFAVSFSAKNLNIEKNNLQIELTVEDDTYFTGENKNIKSKKIIFNSEVIDAVPQVAIIPVISRNKIINIKGKIKSNEGLVEFNKILKVPETNDKVNNNDNTSPQVLSFVPSQKENINNKNIKNIELTISTGEVKILAVDEKNFSVISDNFGETKVVLADGESVNLNKVQVIN